MHVKESVMQAVQVYKSYEVGGAKINALDGIDMDIYSGEFVVLLGPSGAGKTTLLHVLSGLEAPDKGQVLLGDRDLYSMPDAKLSRLRNNHFGFIFQSYNLIQSLTVLENVEIPLRIAGTSEASKHAKAMLERVGLGERLLHRPAQLSGGEQQRVSVARALVCEPRMLFADEPTGNLDSKNGTEIMDLLSVLVRERGAACVMVTHYAAWAERANRVFYVRDGKLVDKI